MTTTQARARAAVSEQPAELLETVEEAFAAHPAFGDRTYILEQLRVCLEHRLERIAPQLASAAELRDALAAAGADSLDHVIGDTVVRCAILHAHARLESKARRGLPLEDCGHVFAATAHHLREGGRDTPLADGSLRRVGPKTYHGWIWDDEHAEDVFARSFRSLLEDRYQAVPVTATDEEVVELETGARLLDELLPTLTPSALQHAQVIAVVPSAGGWTGIASASQYRLGGTIFLGRFMQGPWWMAEHLLHEALHQKLYDFRQGHLLLEMDAGRTGAPKIASLWNSPRMNDANLWDVHRVYAAFHVYAHLALFGAVAEQRAAELEDEYGPIRGMTPSAKALERAHYLGEQLREQCWEHLGLAGQRMADWLISVLDVLDPDPPPKAAYLHLCLDLYEREAGQVASALAEERPGTTLLRDRLVPLATAEVESARAILDAVGAPQDLDRLEQDVAVHVGDDFGGRFPELRLVIARALRAVSPDGYRVGESEADDDLLKETIASASRRLFAVLSGDPPAVAEAKLRASELGFRESARDEVGRLLAVLAAAVPPDGRILEVGTGAGRGTAWIASGLDRRTDVEVVSVEVEPRLVEAMRGSRWPDYVRMVGADAVEALPSLGKFDLVFADAAPVKYHHLEAVLAALRPGGLLVVDDLEAHEQSTDEQRAEKEALRSALLEDPDLQAVALDASSGLLIAARSRAIA
jgi:predicted O-methyltransferase YrrM